MIIDFHVYPFMIQELVSGDSDAEKAVDEIFGLHFPAQPLSVFFSEMDEAGVDRSVIFPIDCTTAHGSRILTNETVAGLCDGNPRLTGFASVDPNTSDAAGELDTAVKKLGLKGVKLDPALQQFEMSSDNALTVYQKAGELGIPVLIDCGLNWAPAAMIGSGNPLCLEKAVVYCPETNFVIGHLAWPWTGEASAMAMKYPNVYLDTSVVYSGTPAECLDHVINGTIGRGLFERNLASKVVYGSAYPRADMRRTVRGIKSVGFSEYFLEMMFFRNAENLINL